jgi:hypothetical protein
MRPGACTGSTRAAPFATAEAAPSTTIAPAAIASAAISAAEAALAAWLEAAATTAFKPAATARLRRGRRPVELKLGCHRLSAVLREIERNALAFTEGLDPRLRQRRNMDKDIGPAAIRQYEPKSLCLIKPLNSSSFPHSQPLVLSIASTKLRRGPPIRAEGLAKPVKQ